MADPRRFVEDELGLAGAGDDALLHAQLVATELVTNAARHAESPVELTIKRGHGRVRVEARDGSATGASHTLAGFSRDADSDEPREQPAAPPLTCTIRWSGPASIR